MTVIKHLLLLLGDYSDVNVNDTPSGTFQLIKQHTLFQVQIWTVQQTATIHILSTSAKV